MNSVRFPILLIIAVAVCMCLNIHVHAQEETGGARTVVNFKGFEIGYGYPYTTLPWQNKVYARQFSYGLRANYFAGRKYPSGIAIAVTPGLSFVSIGPTEHGYERRNTNGMVTYSQHRVTQYRNLAFNLMGSSEFSLFKLRLLLGAFTSTSLSMKGNYDRTTITFRDHPFFPHNDTDHNNYDYTNQFSTELGVIAQFFIPLNKSGNRETLLGVGYSMQITPTYYAYTSERWVSLSFIRRYLIIKEVRKKWDRLLMRQG